MGTSIWLILKRSIKTAIASGSRMMAEAIPGAELLEIPNASHTAPIERPHLVDFTIRDFIARRVDGATMNDATVRE